MTSTPEITITLRPVDGKNFQRVVELEVDEAQRHFVAPNVYSIAEAWIEPSFVPLAVYAGEELVGFAMYGLEEPTGRWWIVRLMIDRRFQGRGYGRAAAQALIELLIARENPDSITLSYEPDNQGAAALYRSLGFVETGEIDEGEIVARLDLSRRGSKSAAR